MNETELVIKKVRKYTIEEGGGAWKIALADFMTALMIVFFTLWTISSKSDSEMAALADYFKGKEVIDDQNIKLLEATYLEVKDILAEQGVVISLDKNNKSITIKFDSETLFGIGSYDLKPQAIDTLGKFAKAMSKKDFYYHVYGYTDDIPVKRNGKLKSNLQLSVFRSMEAGLALSDGGISSDRVTIHGEGQLNPISDNSTADGKGHNRRVEIYMNQSSVPTKVYGKGVTFSREIIEDVKQTIEDKPNA